jgi:hypothetical protein
MNDQVERLKEIQRKHEESITKMNERGYDVKNLPPLTEQERDEFDMVIHNAKRTGKFDWGMNETNSATTFVKVVLFLASLIPLFIAFDFLFEADGVLRFLVPFLVCVCLVHVYFGFVWARYLVALSSLVPALIQLLMLDGLQASAKYFVFFVLISITINSYLLLKSEPVSQFLMLQRGCISDSKLNKLKLSRWTLGVLLMGAIAADGIRIVF